MFELTVLVILATREDAATNLPAAEVRQQQEPRDDILLTPLPSSPSRSPALELGVQKARVVPLGQPPPLRQEPELSQPRAAGRSLARSHPAVDPRVQIAYVGTSAECWAALMS